MEGFCRGCLLRYDEPTELLQYTERNRRLFIYSTGLQVKRNDTFTFQLCKECYFNMKQSCKFKKQCRSSDKKFQNYLLVKGEVSDFGSYIKNMDGNLLFRLPLASGYSTPAYQKNREDDNESTCTSIRNFMPNIWEGEEMPLTEARIIREVIEEEADVLDDSLDSHWLQDDMTIGSDFDVDFGLSPFGTPRSVINECFTPRKINEAKQRELNYLTSKEIIDQIDKPRISQKFDMPLLDGNIDFDNVANIQVKGIKIENFDTVDNANIKQEGPELHDFDNSIPSDVEDMVTENSISNTLQHFKTDLLVDLAGKKQMDVLGNDNANFATLDETSIVNEAAKKTITADMATDTDICIVLNQGIAKKTMDVPLTNELDYYVNKAELKKKITSRNNEFKEYHCSIDRNLDIALKLEENEEIPLEQLIISPAVSARSVVSTPTINNILFGAKDKDTPTSSDTSTHIKNIIFGELKTEKAPKYFPQVGQSLLDFEDDFKQDEILHIRDKIKDNCAVKTELENPEDHYITEQKTNTDTAIKIENHEDVLEEFLRAADADTTKLDEDIIDQIMDPIDLSKELSDKDIFKRPQTPPYDKFDLENSLCKICNKSFKSSRTLKIHVCKIHKYKIPNTDPHRNKLQNNTITMCPTCGLPVKGVANYAKHKQRHMDSPDVFECDKCPLFFKTRTALRTHMRMHMEFGEKEKDSPDVFQCDKCTLFFKTRTALRTHMRMHTGLGEKEKNFVCSTCGHLSATSSQHKMHHRRHLKKVSETCDICHKGFYCAYDLKVHMRKHSGDRPYECQYCPNIYKRRESLYQHVKRHMGKLEFKCEACDLEFVTKQILTQHYGSRKCKMKRNAESQNLRNVSGRSRLSGKGSLQSMKKMLQCEELENNESDGEVYPDNDENMSCVED